LDRIMTINHVDDPNFAALRECQAKAREIRAAVLDPKGPTEESAAEILETTPAFSALLTLVEGREHLDDAKFAVLEDSVTRLFGRTLTVAATRGKLVAGPADLPRAPERPAPRPKTVEEPVGPVVVAAAPSVAPRVQPPAPLLASPAAPAAASPAPSAAPHAPPPSPFYAPPAPSPAPPAPPVAPAPAAPPPPAPAAPPPPAPAAPPPPAPAAPPPPAPAAPPPPAPAAPPPPAPVAPRPRAPGASPPPAPAAPPPPAAPVKQEVAAAAPAPEADRARQGGAVGRRPPLQVPDRRGPAGRAVPRVRQECPARRGPGAGSLDSGANFRVGDGDEHLHPPESTGRRSGPHHAAPHERQAAVRRSPVPRDAPAAHRSVLRGRRGLQGAARDGREAEGGPRRVQRRVAPDDAARGSRRSQVRGDPSGTGRKLG